MALLKKARLSEREGVMLCSNAAEALAAVVAAVA
jgi:hypothetical protein